MVMYSGSDFADMEGAKHQMTYKGKEDNDQGGRRH